MRRSTRQVATALVMAMLGGGASALAADPVVLTYDIRKDGENIGRETVRIVSQDGRAMVDVETHTRARVLFLDFHYDHERHEEWRDGALVRMTAETDDDGTVSRLQATAAADGWDFTVNGKSTHRAGDLLPLTLWGRSLLTKAELFSVIDAQPYRIAVASLGRENLSVGSATQSCEHFRMSGDVERELWYGQDGYLVRTTFRRAGYPIEMVRDGH